MKNQVPMSYAHERYLGRPSCPKCGEMMMAPSASEYRDGCGIRHCLGLRRMRLRLRDPDLSGCSGGQSRSLADPARIGRPSTEAFGFMIRLHVAHDAAAMIIAAMQ